MTDKDYEIRLKSTGRNDLCPCGSGKKYKKCHLDADEEARHQDFAKAQAAAQEAAKAAEASEEKEGQKIHPETASHKKENPAAGMHQSRPGNVTRQVSSPRKVGG